MAFLSIEIKAKSNNQENIREILKSKRADFCLADVTQEQFIAGGMICGKVYKDIEDSLEKYGYQKISRS